MIRPARRTDVASILSIYEPIVQMTPITFETEPPTEEDMTARLTQSYAWLVYEADDELLGYAYGGPFHPRPAYRWSAEVSIYLGAAARGRGIGRELLNALLQTLRERGVVNAFAGIALPNPASVRLFESLRFERIALQKKVGYKLGSWHDVGWWQLQLREASLPPPPLRLDLEDHQGGSS